MLLITYEEARRLVMELARPSTSVQVSLKDARNLVLAEDVTSKDDVPFSDNSAMDGFAVKHEDIRGATRQNPKVLKLAGEVPAGKVFQGTVESGEAVSIYTGAPIPEGADTVVELEATEVSGNLVYVFEERERGANIRKRGEDVRRGQVVFERGTVVTPAVAGVLASIGRTAVRVFRPPVVSIVSTGSELIEPDEELTTGKVRNSNTYLLEALLSELPVKSINFGTVADELERLKTCLVDAVSVSDAVITTGGVSLGDYDLVKVALEGLGFRRVFWKVAQKPGKPLAFYEKEGKVVFGLPGNPAAVHITFLEYVRPYLLRLLGYENAEPVRLVARLKGGLKKKPGRLNFIRVRITEENGEIWAEKAGAQGSGVLSTSAFSNAIALIPAEKELVQHGEEVVVHYYSNLGW